MSKTAPKVAPEEAAETAPTGDSTGVRYQTVSADGCMSMIAASNTAQARKCAPSNAPIFSSSPSPSPSPSPKPVRQTARKASAATIAAAKERRAAAIAARMAPSKAVRNKPVSTDDCMSMVAANRG